MSYSRSTMGQSRLPGLSVLREKNRVTGVIAFDNAINQFVTLKSRLANFCCIMSGEILLHFTHMFAKILAQINLQPIRTL